MKATFKYWIDIGRTNGQFTLHRRLLGRPEHPMVKEYTYIRNLGRVWEEACERADDYIAKLHTNGYDFDYLKQYDVSEGWSDCRHAGKYDDTRFWFGKYNGEEIDDVIANDVEYVKYIRDNFLSNNPRMKSLIEKLESMDLGKSEAELAAERRAAEQNEYDNRKQPIPVELAEGRHTFTGTIIATYQRDTMYGTVTKMIFEDDRNFRINGTAPNALWNDSSETPTGCRVEFDATLQISDDDECFGFFKRPTKVVITEQSEERLEDIEKWNKIHEEREELGLE